MSPEFHYTTLILGAVIAVALGWGMPVWQAIDPAADIKAEDFLDRRTLIMGDVNSGKTRFTHAIIQLF